MVGCLPKMKCVRLNSVTRPYRWALVLYVPFWQFPSRIYERNPMSVIYSLYFQSRYHTETYNRFKFNFSFASWGFGVLGFVLPKVRGCVVMLGLIGGGVGIWLVLDGLSTGEDEFLSLLMLDRVWSLRGDLKGFKGGVWLWDLGGYSLV